MKRMLFLFGMLFLALACQEQPIPDKPDDPSSQGGKNQDSFSATIEQRYSETKASQAGRSAGASVEWRTGDQIRVFNSDHVSGVVFTLQSGDGQSEGTFVGEKLSGEGPFFFVYPASMGGTLSGEQVKAIHVPETQYYVFNSSGRGAGMAVGRASALSGRQSIALQNLDALLLLPVNGGKAVSKIHVYTNGPESLCGTATLSIPDEGSPSLAFDASPLDGTGQRLTLDCGRRGVPLSNSDTKFYLSVPAGSFTQGLYWEVLDMEQNAMPGYRASQTSVDRNVVCAMEPVTYAARYKAAFLLPELVQSPARVEAGGFTGVLSSDGSLVPCCPYVRGVGQYAFSAADGARNIRIQDWSRGFSLSLGIPAGELFVPGTSTTKAVSVNPQGNTGGIASGSAPMRVVKKVGERVWLSDGSNGYIMIVED